MSTGGPRSLSGNDPGDFIDPTNYGIISPPVRYAIRQSSGKNYIDEYLDFLRVLRRYKEAYNFTRVADVDISLWILSYKCILSGDSSCENFMKYEKMLVHLDEEIIKKSRAFREMQDDLFSILAEEQKKQGREIKKATFRNER